MKEKLLNFKRSLIHAVFEGAELEGLGLTLSKTSDILKQYNKSKNIYSWNQIEDVNGVFTAYQYVIDIIQKQKELGLNEYKEINRLVDEYEEHSNAGHWRKELKFIGGTKYVPPILNGHEYVEIFEKELRDISSFNDVVIMFAKLCKAQCFPDGNKRTNLIFANALCLKFNYKIIRIINHVSFARKLVDYYNDDINLDKFIRYVNETSNLDFKEYKQSVTVGQTIQSLMEYYGINESELARIIGVDRSYVNRIISGERKPSIKIAKAIAEALHIKWDTLFQ